MPDCSLKLRIHDMNDGDDEVADMAVVMSRFGCEIGGGMLQGYKVLAGLGCGCDFKVATP